MISDISAISDSGTTDYVKAITKAFAITAKSDESNYGSGCNRIYVFLTDGAPARHPNNATRSATPRNNATVTRRRC